MHKETNSQGYWAAKSMHASIARIPSPTWPIVVTHNRKTLQCWFRSISMAEADCYLGTILCFAEAIFSSPHHSCSTSSNSTIAPNTWEVANEVLLPDYCETRRQFCRILRQDHNPHKYVVLVEGSQLPFQSVMLNCMGYPPQSLCGQKVLSSGVDD